MVDALIGKAIGMLKARPTPSKHAACKLIARRERYSAISLSKKDAKPGHLTDFHTSGDRTLMLLSRRWNQIRSDQKFTLRIILDHEQGSCVMRYFAVMGLSIALSASWSLLGHADQEQTFDAGKREAFEQIKARNKTRLGAYRQTRPHTQGGRIEAECSAGKAGIYPCHDIDLVAHLSLEDFDVLSEVAGGDITMFNDIWGYTDRKTRREYALLGANRGTIAIEVTEPGSPKIVGILPSVVYSENGDIWRDIKVRGDHAFIVTEIAENGLQVWDLSSLSEVGANDGPVRFDTLTVYNGFSSAHNVNINVDSGFAYAIGTDTCLGGMEMVDISDPANPSDAGCYKDDGYIHDTQCVIYHGPDTRFTGREICVHSAGELTSFIDPQATSISVVDVTDKENVERLVEFSYQGLTGVPNFGGYSHQGWLTPDHRVFLHNDELDEFLGSVSTTTTRVWDLTDLTNPTLVSQKTNGVTSVDHNIYTRGEYSFHSNYRSGLRLFHASNAANGELPELAFFDVFPEDDAADFNGNWSNYPFFQFRARNMVAVSSIEDGFFLLEPRVRIFSRDDRRSLAAAD